MFIALNERLFCTIWIAQQTEKKSTNQLIEQNNDILPTGFNIIFPTSATTLHQRSHHYEVLHQLSTKALY